MLGFMTVLVVANIVSLSWNIHMTSTTGEGIFVLGAALNIVAIILGIMAAVTFI